MTLPGILLVNLGSPLSPSPRDVKRYLIEFLTDKRVIDLPWWKRQLLVRGIIVPRRYLSSAQGYKEIWTQKGSPLLVHSENLRNELQNLFGNRAKVALGMRYQSPSIKEALRSLFQNPLSELIIVPLFPQYASATTGSVHQKIMQELRNERSLPHLTFLSHYADHPEFIKAWIEQIESYPLSDYEHLVFSFHGLPQEHLIRSDRGNYCMRSPHCCQTLNSLNSHCYSAQCFATAQALVSKLNLSKDRYTIAFQSRLGKDPWLKPYMSDILPELVAKNLKKILVISPSFTCDCLETLQEIEKEYRDEFIKAGGVALDLVKSLNASPTWVRALKTIISERSFSLSDSE